MGYQRTMFKDFEKDIISLKMYLSQREGGLSEALKGYGSGVVVKDIKFAVFRRTVGR